MNAKPAFSNSDVQKVDGDARDATTQPAFQFSVRSLLAMVTVAGLLCALASLLVTNINHAREAARRNGCMGRICELSVSIKIHENTTGRYPLANSSDRGLLVDQPGNAQGMGFDAGYSWLVQLLPYYGERELFRDIEQGSNAFARPAFDPAISTPAVTGAPHASAVATWSVPRCPTSSGSAIVDASAAPEYNIPHPAFAGGVGLTHYMAIPGTHIENGDVVENGLLVSAKANRGLGIRPEDVSDGLSNTILLVESRERGYASWYDGTTAWVVGAPDGIVARDCDGDGQLDLGKDPQTALNFGSARGSKVFLRANTWGGRNARRWGPSSEHIGGVVNHGFADRGYKAISVEIDPTVYVQLITRGGSEQVTQDDALGGLWPPPTPR